MIGTKHGTEAADSADLRVDGVVGERCCQRRRRTVRSAGAAASENAGISNEKAGENPARRKPKVSWGRLIHPGLVDPKSRPKGVDNG